MTRRVLNKMIKDFTRFLVISLLGGGGGRGEILFIFLPFKRTKVKSCFDHYSAVAFEI